MTLEWGHMVIALLVFLGGCLFTAWRIGYVVASFIGKINEQMAAQKAEFHALLELKEAEAGEKVGRVYKRFDEYKNVMENNFVRREMCQLTHNGTTQQLAELNKKMDTQGEKLDALIIKVAGIK